MMKRNKNEISPLQNNLNSEVDVDDSGSSQHKQNRIVIRYKYAVSAFHKQCNLEDALIELRKLDFPMSQVYVVKNEASPLKSVVEVDVKSDLNSDADLQMSDDRAKYYQHLVARGEHLLVLNATDIQIAGVKKVIQDYGVRDFDICPQTVES